MNFIEAKKILRDFEATGESTSFCLAMSGTADPLLPFVNALGARDGRKLDVRTLPFNTLTQYLLSKPAEHERELFLLMPWDFVPAWDWRSGVYLTDSMDVTPHIELADKVRERLSGRSLKAVFIDAPVPPVFADPAVNSALQHRVRSYATSLGATCLDAQVFNLETYLDNGCAFDGTNAYTVASALYALLLPTQVPSNKVLVTDLDNVMWQGVIGEDGLDGISCGPDGPGYKHWIYQDFLSALIARGIVVAAVSRNDEELALMPFRAGKTRIPEVQLAAVLASYNAKSAQIKTLSEHLNLGLDSFVFVDDNPVELAEVTEALPMVKSLRFPDDLLEFPEFLNELNALFARTTITEEDTLRTDMYRRSLARVVPSDLDGSDLSDYLSSLGMRLVIHERTKGSHDRAFDLINKTNQFNINGRRWARDEFDAAIRNGAQVFTASLTDNGGSHGEIAVCLITKEGTIRSFVLSCRVFQRRVEHAFLSSVLIRCPDTRTMDVIVTDRNTPAINFLKAEFEFGSNLNPDAKFDAGSFISAQNKSLNLFEISYE